LNPTRLGLIENEVSDFACVVVHNNWLPAPIY
jgi:hypothetical protein